MDVRILGPLELVTGRGALAVPRGRARALLGLLVLRHGTVVPTDRLIDELWGETPPATAHKSLHNLVVRLRRFLTEAGPGAPRLETRTPGYVLHLNDGALDASRFRQLVADAAGAAAAERAALLREALALWRGPALADFLYDPFAQAEIAALEELRLTALEQRIDADLELGGHVELIGELGGLVAEHPFRDRLRAQLMLALYRCGRQADALEVYRTGRSVLADELGIEPGPALAALEGAILRQDPSLGLAEAPVSGTGAAPIVDAGPWLEAERRTVTVAYVGLGDRDAQQPDADPEVARRSLAGAVEVATAVVERHGGAVEGVIAGVLVAVFGLPVAHEDDALRAGRAALELTRAMAVRGRGGSDRGTPLRPRVGLSTGEVVVGDVGLGRLAVGGTVDLAARLQQAAAPGEVVIGETTRRALAEAATVQAVATLVLDRRGRPVTVWRLQGVSARAPTRSADRSQELVGRRRELARLHAAFARTARTRRATRITVVGDPGIGKTRLALEFVESLAGDAIVLRCSCPPYGDGITFWPLRQLLDQVTGGRGVSGRTGLLTSGTAAADAAVIARAVGLDEVHTDGAELFPAVRRLLETLAQRAPVVLVVDDVHWAQPAFEELLAVLADSVEAPVLIVCLARPDLRPDALGGARTADGAARLRLAALSDRDSERLVHARLDGRLVPDAVVSQVVALAQGNPLFIEQLLAAVREEGKLRSPASIDALLAARLDLLGPGERDLLRCAAVIGTDFSFTALRALVPSDRHRFVRRHLDALVAKELVRPASGRRPADEAYSFQHGLLQQAAYRSMTRATRARLHERLADWLERSGGEASDEVLAYHLERAHDEQAALDAGGEELRRLALRAGVQLASAGLRAYERFDMTAAANLLERTRRLLPLEHPRRPEVLRRLAQAYPTLGRLEAADGVLVELLATPGVRDDPRTAARLRLEQLRVQMIAGPDPVPLAVVEAEVRRLAAILEPLDDAVGLSQASYVLAMLHLRSGDMDALEAVGRRAFTHAARTGDLREELAALWWSSWALVEGPVHVTDAVAACEALLHHGRRAHVGVLTDIARLRAMEGAFDEARALIGQARRDVVERIRVRRARTVVAHRAGQVESLAGDLDAAADVLREGLEVALDVGERDQTAQLAAELSRALAAQGEYRDADALAELSRRQAPAESVAAQALWRAATALARGLQGDPAAETFAREAVDHVPSAMLNLRAERHRDLAAVLSALGHHTAADAAGASAAGLYEAKGNRAGLRRLAALRGESDAAAR